MAHQPILLPDDSKRPSDSAVTGSAHHEISYPFLQITQTLAAHGAGSGSADLALDLILNDIVEQACIATGATGAAIALLREEEMVCRATTGADAPGLGVRLDTRSGLSGACVQERALQSCNDAQNDPRVDAEACREAGIRSILVLPLIEGEEVFGIIEIFSHQPNVFGELDIITLKALAQQIVQNRKQAHDTTDKLETTPLDFQTGVEGLTTESAPPTETPFSGIQQPASHVQFASRTSRQSSSPVDFWTAFLAVLVIGTAVLMGAIGGWRLASRGTVAAHRRAAPQRSSAGSPATNAANSAATTKTGDVPSSPDTLASAQNSAPPASPAPKPKLIARAKASPDPPVGGLVIYEQGRMIYRMSPSTSGAEIAGSPSRRTSQGPVILAGQISSETAQVQEEVAAAHLIRRVEPRYPPQAEQQRIEGPVVLDAEISPEGAVRRLSVVKGNPVLAASALQAVKQWRYQPYQLDEHPVGMHTTITLNFTLPAK